MEGGAGCVRSPFVRNWPARLFAKASSESESSDSELARELRGDERFRFRPATSTHR